MAETEDLKSFQCRFESDRGHCFKINNLINYFRPRGSVVEQLIRNEQIVGSIPTEGSSIFCRDDGIRTHGLQTPSLTRYQAALRPGAQIVINLAPPLYSTGHMDFYSSTLE